MARLFNFSWVTGDGIAAMGEPAADDARELLALGIRNVVSLTRRPPFRDSPEGLRTLHLPVVDMTAPTVRQLADAVRFLEEAASRGERSVVHCLAGQGRTGTVVAALYVARGADPAEAIAAVRDLRPGSIETAEQEHAVHRFAEAFRAGDVTTKGPVAPPPRADAPPGAAGSDR